VGEWPLRRKDGTFVIVEASTKILPDGRWQALVRDITERKQAQAALAEAHRTEHALRCELERVLAASGAVSDALTRVPEGSLHVALEAIAKQAQRLTDAAAAAASIDGAGDQAREGWVFLGMAPEQATAIARWTREARRAAPRERQTVRVDRHAAPGELVPGRPSITSLLAVPIRSRGQPVGNLYLTNTRRPGGFDEGDERTVQALAARPGTAIELARLYEREGLERAWLETIVEQLPEAVVIADARGGVVQQNEAALRLARDTGRADTNSITFDHELRLPSGAELAPDERPLQRALSRGEDTLCRELCLVKPGGDLLAMLVSARPIRTARGLAGAIMVLQDISALKELERLRDEWSSIVAHDLRQPVSVIAMAVELLRTGELRGVEQKALERIRGASARLDRMIGDLLDVSRIDARRLSLRRRVVDLSGLVERAVEELHEALSRFRVTVAVEPVALVYADPDRIEQVLANLLTNAAKYGAQGTEIRVEVRREGDQLRVSVTNHGAGIPPDELPQLFDRFARTRDARASAVPGIGLGLYISKGLVESHGGRIWAESTPGETTRVSFTLPAMARAPLHAPPP
jgi:PAS domain S-box-containing protein